MAELFYPKNLSNQDMFPCHIHFAFFTRSGTFASGLNDQIHLYMPEHISNPSTISWDDYKGMEMISSAVSSLAGYVMDRTKSAKVAQAATIAQRSGSAAAGDLGAVGKALSYYAGVVVNPYITQMFHGVDLRSFEFIFKFFPQSLDDCDTINLIINTFRKYSLPSAGSAFEGTGLSAANTPYLEYPGEIEVRYVFDGSENPWMHAFKRSVITFLNIDYTGEGIWAVMRNGFPATITMHLKFTELEIVVREDVDEGY